MNAGNLALSAEIAFTPRRSSTRLSRLESVCENSVLEGHGFSRAVNSLRASGLYRLLKNSALYQATTLVP